ncbi:MAG: hypothetical protein NT076_02745 [Candidatus Pacearchaeota archaeon]|nr:hypothetical protein [Candidatus Pacearchaeota archaeon]
MNQEKKEAEVKKIVEDIKSIKIQGASNIAHVGLLAYSLSPRKETKIKLENARPTEPLLFHVLELAEKKQYLKIKQHFEETQARINASVLKIIKNNEKIFTHCHSTNVVKALIYSKKKGKKFSVLNTETRPLFQGRRTAQELSKAGIKVTSFVDSAIATILEKETSKNKIYSTKVFLGADALLNRGIINKIGSRAIAEIARIHKIPLYIIADSWKFSSKKIPIESRNLREIWDRVPKNVKIMNPSFEFVDKKYIKAIVSELGILSYDAFLKKVEKK